MTRNETIAYLSGFFDGEGHIRIQKHSSRGSYMLSLTAVQATSYPLDMFVDAFGGSVHCRDMVYRGVPKRLWEWRISSLAAEKALVEMLDYIVCKKDEAEIALRFRKTFRPQFGDRSKMPQEIVDQRFSMMIDLQEARKAKRKVA